MTEKTKKNILENIKFKNNISKIDNPVINKKIRELSFKKIDIQDNKFFDVITFCAVGRLTRQKNFKEIIEAVNLIPIKFHSKFKVIIIGKGEEYAKLNKLIKLYNLKNVFLVGFKKNPFSYIKNSNYFISSSLWEEPGHAILEAGYLNKLIISSNCPNGPEEILINNFNSIKYEVNNYKSLANIIQNILDNKVNNQSFIKLNMKKIVKNYTMFRFSKKIQQIIN